MAEDSKGSVAEANATGAAGREPRQIVIVDDDVPLARFLGRELGAQGFAVTVFHEGRSALEHVRSHALDLIILDMNMPVMDGMEFLGQVRPVNEHVPILVLTARNSTDDLVQALDRGADDFLNKPFSFLELLARVRSLLRRRRAAPMATAAARVADLVLNTEEHTVWRGERRIELTLREFALLECLMQHAGRPVSRATLMREVWNSESEPATNIVDVYMKYVRDKVDGCGEPKLIRTVRGVGYALDGMQAAAVPE